MLERKIIKLNGGQDALLTKILNFIEGPNVTIVLDNQPHSAVIDLTISSNPNNTSAVFTAGEILSGQRVVMLQGDKVVYYDPTDEENYDKIVGITDQAAVLDEPVRVIMSGIIYNPGWGLNQNKLYFSDLNGTITETPSAEILNSIGLALDSDSLKIKIGQPIITV
jgi:hypothetical protein